MKSIAIMVFMFLTFTVGTNAQENRKAFTAEEQEIVDLSKCKWDWMSEKNVEKLAELFHENSQFVHMGGYWGKQQELETIRTGGIWYKKAEIHDVQVKFAAGTATVYSRRFPFIVTEVYVMEKGKWQLSTLAFTKTLGE